MAVNVDALVKYLVEHEGIKLEAYLEEISGLWHIGIGHLLDIEQSDAELDVMGLEDELHEWAGFSITEEQAYALLEIDINDAIESLHPTFTADELFTVEPARFIAIISMSFQVGGYGVQKKFPSFVKAFKEQDWQRASDEMLWSNGLKKQRHSAWHKQTPGRCEESAKMMLTGLMPGEEVKTVNPLTNNGEINSISEISFTNFTDRELLDLFDGILNELENRLGVERHV